MSSSNPRKKKSSKPRRWPRWLFFFGLILSLIIGVAQGPGLRMLAEKAIGEALEKAGLRGTFRVEGSLFSGLQIRSLYLESDGYLRELHADSLSVDYRLRKIIYGKIDGIRIDQLDLWVDLAATPPTPSEAGLSASDVETELAKSDGDAFDLEAIRLLALPVKILVNHSAINISRGDQWLWRADDISLTHRVGAENYHLTLGHFKDIDDKSIYNQHVTLTWAPNLTSIHNFPIRANAKISQVLCSWSQSTPKHIQADLNWEDSQFHATVEDLTTAKIELTAGSIHLARIAPWIGLKNDLSGQIQQLHIAVPNIMAPPSKMKAKTQVAGKDLRWQSYSIQNLHLETQIYQGKIELNTKLTLDAEEANTIKAQAELSDDTSDDWATCWHGASAQIQINIPEPDQIASWTTANGLIEMGTETAPPGGWPEGGIELKGSATMTGAKLNLAQASLLWNSPSWAGLQWQQLKLDTGWTQSNQSATSELKITMDDQQSIHAKGGGSLITTDYHGELTIDSLNIEKLSPVLNLFKIDTPRAGIVNLTWSGKGQGADITTYQGKIDTSVTGLDAEPQGQPKSNISLTGSYAKELKVEIENLQLSRDKLRIKSAGSWKNNQFSLTQLELHDEEALLIKGDASIPLSQEITDLDTFLKQPGEIDVNFHINNLPLAEIFQQLPPPNDPMVTGRLTLNLNLGGTLRNPTIQCKSIAKRLQLIREKRIPTSDITLQLKTQNDTISLEVNARPDGLKPILVNGKMAFKPSVWIDQPEAIMEETIKATLDTQSINLAQFTPNLPHISKLEGYFSTLISVSGTVEAPKIQGKSRLKISRINSTKESIPDFRNIDIKLNYDKNILTIAPSTCLVAGGKFNLKGTIDANDHNNPIFDIFLSADKALLWRDDSIIARADANVSLKGPYKKARLQGDIGIVESLFYKDIQIIPIGGGNSYDSQPSGPKLPQFTQSEKNKEAPSAIPKPFNQWLLDLKIKTKDDLLIRGNIAKGNVSGNLTIKGTIGEPQPTGVVTLDRAQASLPFSRLTVKEGKAIFTPKHGFDPQLSIKATSRVGSNDVEITLYGLASSPQTLMTSSPPLPENEIVFLLATGSTSDKLNDQGAATGKAYQLLVDTLLRSSPGKFNSVMKKLAELNDKVDVNIGATDPFTGRKYNSASIQVHDRWSFVASMDLDNHSRGLVLYHIRFR